MKIVHLAYSHSPKDIRIFYKECKSLKDNGHDVIYITSTKEIGDYNKEVNKIKIITLKIYKSSRYIRFLKYLKDLYNTALEQDADVYHIHEPLLMYVGLKLKRKGKKIVFDSHENFEGYWDDLFFVPKIFRKPLSSFVWKWLIKSINKSDGIISATPFIAEQFEKYNIKSTIVNNYPLFDDIECNNNDYEKREKICCYTGGISKVRGIDNIIKAIEKVDGKLILAGPLTEEDKMRFEKYKGWEKTEYVGFLNREGINKIYNKSMLGLVTFLPAPNHLDAQPNKMFEYMAAGIPVICSNFPLWEKIIKENKCGICVNPENPNEIANAIKYIFENKEEAKKMGINGRKAILTKYNWNIEKEKLIEFYDKIRS